MKILGIETSCDETALCVLEGAQKSNFLKFKILGEKISSQVKVHEKFGGVFPNLAKREHQKNLVPLLKITLKKAGLLKKEKKVKKELIKEKIKGLREILTREPLLLRNLEKFLLEYQKPKIDYLALTVGPGLEPCLWIGINFAKALAFFWNLEIIPVNHLEAHFVSGFFKIFNQSPPLKITDFFPTLGLIASGGHTQLILAKKIGSYKILGETRDDAAGECFDKTARILNLGFPGGPQLEKFAKKLKNSGEFKIKLPRPMIQNKSFDFSFSGLKTAVLYHWLKQPKEIKESLEYKSALAKEIQQAVIEVLVKKTLRAAKIFPVKSIIVAGGVSANQELRKSFIQEAKKLKEKIKILFPPKKLSTDNAIMVSLLGFLKKNQRIKDFNKIKALANLKITEKIK
jgi:N6-L-threonylcarbamoyladenine synthase